MSAPRHYIRILPSVDGQWYFVLKAPNGKVVMTSETYKTRYDAMRGARSLRVIAGLSIREWEDD